MQMAHLHVLALFALCLGMSTRFVRDRPLARDVGRSVALLLLVVIVCMASQITSALTYPATDVIFDFRLISTLIVQSAVLFFCLLVSYSLGSIYGRNVSSPSFSA